MSDILESIKIKVMSRQALLRVLDIVKGFKVIKKLGVISIHFNECINDPMKLELKTSKVIHSYIREKFDDLDTPINTHDYEAMMTNIQAERIISWFNNNKEDLDILFVYCEGGYSRSSAIGAVLELIQGNTEKHDYYFSDYKRYWPNRWVYYKLLEAAGLFTNENIFRMENLYYNLENSYKENELN